MLSKEEIIKVVEKATTEQVNEMFLRFEHLGYCFIEVEEREKKTYIIEVLKQWYTTNKRILASDYCDAYEMESIVKQVVKPKAIYSEYLGCMVEKEIIYKGEKYQWCEDDLLYYHEYDEEKYIDFDTYIEYEWGDDNE